MSIPALKWAWDIDGITSPQKFVLVALADRANNQHECWPAQGGDIRRRTMLSRQTINQSIKQLEKLGLLTSTPRYGKTKGQMSNIYKLNVVENSSS